MAIVKSKSRHAWRFAFWLMVIARAISTGAQPLANEAKLEAVYLVKFVRFVNWPSSTLAPGQNLVIGVLGNDPFGKMLDDAALDESIGSHALVVRRIRRIAEAQECQVLYVSPSERGRLPSILSGLKGRSILTVSDLDGFAIQGGIVRFLVANNKLRFQINVAAAHDADLAISSKLLELAEIINGPKGPDQ